MENVSNYFWLKPECVIEKIKSLRKNLIELSIKHIIQKLHLNKKDKDRRKLSKGYNSNVRKCLAHRAHLPFETANIIKAALKLEASVTNSATYYVPIISRFRNTIA